MKNKKKINEEDFLIKLLAKNYGQEFLEYLDLLYHENHDDPLELPCKEIESEEPTEIITPTFQNLFMDFVYKMKDDSLLHYEHYSGNLTESKLTHTGRYLFEKREETKKCINTIIVSTGDPDKSIRKLWLGARTNFEVFRIIFLKEYDGEEKLKKIKDIVNNNKKLTIFKVIELILIPLFRISRPLEEIIGEICYLTGKLVDATDDERELLEWGLTLVSSKFVKDPKKLKELREVIKMNNETIQSVLHGYIEDEREYAREEAREEAIMEMANTMINNGISMRQIAEITKLDLNTIKHLSLGK